MTQPLLCNVWWSVYGLCSSSSSQTGPWEAFPLFHLSRTADSRVERNENSPVGFSHNILSGLAGRRLVWYQSCFARLFSSVTWRWTGMCSGEDMAVCHFYGIRQSVFILLKVDWKTTLTHFLMCPIFCVSPSHLGQECLIWTQWFVGALSWLSCPASACSWLGSHRSSAMPKDAPWWWTWPPGLRPELCPLQPLRSKTGPQMTVSCHQSSWNKNQCFFFFFTPF